MGKSAKVYPCEYKGCTNVDADDCNGRSSICNAGSNPYSSNRIKDCIKKAVR